MKKIKFNFLLIATFAMIVFVANAQDDQIFKQSGDTIEENVQKVMEISTEIPKTKNDQIFKHSGEIIEGNVLRITEFGIVFKYAGEDTENTISKYAVGKIIYGKSQRVEEISEKIIVNSAKDWEKVIIIEDRNLIAGLKKGSEIRGKTSFVNFHTANTGDKKAMQKMKEEAAASQCQFILILTEKSSVGSKSNQLGGSQAIKTGISYRY